MPKATSSRGLPEGNLEDSLWQLILAPGVSKLKLIRKLIDAGVNVNKQDKNGRTCLLYAVDRKRYKLVQMLLNAGADPNLCSQSYWLDNCKYDAPLYRSLQLADRQLFCMLLEAGADVNDLKRDEFIRIMYEAIDKGRPKSAEIFELFLQHGVDTSCVDLTCERSLLGSAAMRGRANLVELLLEWGADPNLPYRMDRSTPLFGTTFKDDDNSFCVNLLLASGADLNYKNILGRVFLHYATSFGKHELVDCLIKHIALLDDEGKFVDPQNYALINRRHDSTDFFHQCKSELEVMKRRPIAYSIPYYALLTNDRKLRQCARNETVASTFERDDQDDEFPIYSEYLRILFERERDRAILERKAVKVLSRVFRFNLSSRPSICRTILWNLRIPDLRSLCSSQV